MAGADREVGRSMQVGRREAAAICSQLKNYRMFVVSCREEEEDDYPKRKGAKREDPSAAGPASD